MIALNWQAFRGRNLHQRCLSSLILAPLALLIAYKGGTLFAIAVTVISLLGLREWLRLVGFDARALVVYLSYAFLSVIMAVGAFSVPFGALLGTVLLLVLFLFAVREHEERAGWIVLGFPYMAGFGLALLDLRSTLNVGMAEIYYLLAVVWATDIGAYIFGRLVGGPKLAPVISPNKTWAGLIGGMVLAALCSYAVVVVLHAKQPWAAAAFAVVVAGVSQLGDLFESYIKRLSGQKESGSIIPGHGGILDRIDGLVFAAIFYVLFQSAVGQNLLWW